MPLTLTHVQEDAKKKRTALKEARIAFLEEEVPALVAKGASLAEVKVKCKNVNTKLGSKFEISETELEGTYEACSKLLREGADISGVAGSSSAAERILAEEVGGGSRDVCGAQGEWVAHVRGGGAAGARLVRRKQGSGHLLHSTWHVGLALLTSALVLGRPRHVVVAP